MPFVVAAVVLLAVALVAVGWMFYRTLLENGRRLLRIEALERRMGPPTSTEDLMERWQEFVRPLAVNDSYDSENILPNVVFADEYRIRYERLEPGDVVVDVGANIGTFTLLCHLLGSRAIFSYEPGQQNFRLLKRNVGALPGVHIFPEAVWRSDVTERQQLTLSEGSNSGQHSVLAAGHVLEFVSQQLVDSVAPPYTAAAVPLDAILERFNRVKLLKIDCEGSEFPILLTSQQLHRVERVVGEIHEQEAELLKQLDPRTRVGEYAAYYLADVVARLEACGFEVATRLNDLRHIYLFEARRKGREQPADELQN